VTGRRLRSTLRGRLWPRVRRGVFPRLLVVMALSSLPQATLLGYKPKPVDYEVKAIYLLNFGRFATWPPAASSDSDTFWVCVLGRDPFGRVLDDALIGETIAGKRVAAKRVPRSEDAAGCRILFISDSEEKQLKQVLQSAARARTLTVSDMPQFVEEGGMIQFISQGNKVRFAVNVGAAEQAGP
jgi:hypothetical protein